MENMAEKLEALPSNQACIFVMVQCYSGGFAQVMFKDGSHKKGLSKTQAGFLPPPTTGLRRDVRRMSEKVITGNTHPILGSVGGHRTGTKVQNRLRRRRQTSMSEAHAYVIIRSDTIDLPVKTSEIWLRTVFSPGYGEKKPTEKKDVSSKLTELAEKILGKEGWLGKILKNPSESKISMEELMNMAEPEERAILRELSQSLDLNGTNAFSELTKILI